MAEAEQTFNHSEEWMQKLTCPMEALSPAERDAIARHVVACPDCARTLADYAHLEWLIRALPGPALPPGLPPKLLARWQEELDTISKAYELPVMSPTSENIAERHTGSLAEYPIDSQVDEAEHLERVDFLEALNLSLRKRLDKTFYR